MATKTQVGTFATCDNDYGVYLEGWADNKAPEALAIEGYACGLYFDPGTREGREAVTSLIDNLRAALAAHDKIVEEIYVGLKPGDDATRIRVAGEPDAQCTALVNGDQCWRVDHVDGHHVTISDTDEGYIVAAVRHES